MNQPPKTLDLVLEDTDVRKDMSVIMESMAKIRAEAIQDIEIPSAKKDEYLHLAYRLASGLKATLDDSRRQKLNVVASKLDKNPTLLAYDPAQDGHWKKTECDFINTLDELLISFEGDSFASLDDKHHLLQAIKYLAAGDSIEERQKIYDTILPFQGGVAPNSNSSKLKNVFKSVFGRSISTQKVNSLTLKVEDGFEFLNELTLEARALGYSRLRFEVPEEKFDNFKRENPSFNVLGTILQAEPKCNESLRKTIRNIFQYTRPFSNYILGSFNNGQIGDFLKYIFPEKNENSRGNIAIPSVIVSLGVNIIGGASLVYLGFRPEIHSLATVSSGLYLIAEALGRLIYTWVLDDLPPTLLAKLSTVTTNIIRPTKNSYSGKNFESELNIATPIQVKRVTNHALDYLQNIAATSIPQDIEQNIVWSESNHHDFGNKYRDYMLKTASLPLGINTSLDRTNQALVYCSSEKIDSYVKDNYLICFAGKRYVLTSVSNKEIDIASSKLLEGLRDSKDDRAFLENFSKANPVKYMHLRKFESSGVTSDYEFTS
jgi:hypothetical protein